MAASSLRLICGATLAGAALLGFGATGAAQGPGQPPKRIAPKLDAVLPLLNASLVRVREAGTEQALTGLRTADDQTLVWVPGTGPLPQQFEVGIFDTWSPATVLAAAPGDRYLLLRTAGHREPARRLDPALLEVPAFVVAAAGAGKTLDVQTVWVDPREPITLAAGAAVFAMDGRLAGLVTEKDGRKALVPGTEVLARAALLAAEAKARSGG
jgi:hypothetical protein